MRASKVLRGIQKDHKDSQRLSVILWGRGEAPQTEVSGLEEANRALKEEVALLRSILMWW